MHFIGFSPTYLYNPVDDLLVPEFCPTLALLLFYFFHSQLLQRPSSSIECLNLSLHSADWRGDPHNLCIHYNNIPTFKYNNNLFAVLYFFCTTSLEKYI